MLNNLLNVFTKFPSICINDFPHQNILLAASETLYLGIHLSTYGNLRCRNQVHKHLHALFSIINWNQDWNDWIYANCFGNQNGFADRTDLFCIPFCLCANFFFYTKFSKIEITLSTRFFFLQLIAIILSTLAFTNTSIIDPNMHLKKTKLNAKVQKN